MQGQMWSYILKRVLLMIPTLLGVLTLTFAVVQFVPEQNLLVAVVIIVGGRGLMRSAWQK